MTRSSTTQRYNLELRHRSAEIIKLNARVIGRVVPLIRHKMIRQQKLSVCYLLPQFIGVILVWNCTKNTGPVAGIVIAGTSTTVVHTRRKCFCVANNLQQEESREKIRVCYLARRWRVNRGEPANAFFRLTWAQLRHKRAKTTFQLALARETNSLSKGNIPSATRKSYARDSPLLRGTIHSLYATFSHLWQQ